MALALISAGSNLGDSQALLTTAVHQLRTLGHVLKVSALYRTKPVGLVEQPDFLNLALSLETTLSPLDLLHGLQGIENAAGRKRIIHWGPRTLDLDLIAYQDLKLASPELSLPHPRATERAFVLVPLNEIVPDFYLTPTLSVKAACARLNAAALAEVVEIGRIAN
ncbi:MAG: 2-amino-4-hydroxy-6-hydroxymethyldihydropteridine diphosphokinase [Candidatus Anaerobiospirillum merdipullorum]|uniref:2-amino-4-hydroxy-6-hydroxymethyldihydropteridine pyrophosphokinase n=1 Tax=Candidatus Anaerobiospirillum merdipullorum TaxID=2838450 RepID=A0A9E2KM44_9GAMM|nr:2-amino-4-hydroxy-6-hydroxymethyldihydropteridine diphosphokinase [Candidatus Anaerobiospirillum merdipullorum]